MTENVTKLRTITGRVVSDIYLSVIEIYKEGSVHNNDPHVHLDAF